MSQISFADAEQAGKRKRTRREVFLSEMEVVVPWKALLKVIEPHYPSARFDAPAGAAKDQSSHYRRRCSRSAH